MKILRELKEIKLVIVELEVNLGKEKRKGFTLCAKDENGYYPLVYHDKYGWNNPNSEIMEVDIVGHSWFFKREWLSCYWRELPDIKSSSFVGEDIHFSYTLQKYLNLSTYVPPHPKNNKSLWGSTYDYAMTIGTDNNAISYNSERQKEMSDSLVSYINNGFKLKYLEDLKYKKIYLKTKKEIKKLF